MSDATSRRTWEGRRVLLTGHTGFKGAWLSLLLTDLGAEVHGLALSADACSLYRAANIDAILASSTIGDVRDLPVVERAITEARPEVVLHLAAQALVRPSYVDPVGTFATNVMGVVNVLDATRRADSVKAVVVVTSDKAYENREWLWPYREDEPMGGHDPYSSSKGCAELVTSAYRRSFFSSGVKVASARAGNVIGGGDWSEDRLVPDLVRGALEARPTLIRNPNAVRPWQHVLEPLSGYLALAHGLLGANADACANAFNFGPESGSEQSVGRLADAVSEAWGPELAWACDGSDQPHEAQLLKLDSARARHRLGWNPVWDFPSTIARTVAWYRAYADGEDMTAFTRAQIADYLGARGESKT